MPTLNNITSQDTRKNIARNLQIHAWYLSQVNSGAVFDNSLYQFKVQRGFYNPGPTESPSSGSVNALATEGRAVVYELVSKGNGQVDVAKTYDLALYLKDFLPFEKLILDYDTYNPNGEITASIIIITPNFPKTYTGVRYLNQVETRFNNKVQSSNSLISCYQPPGTAIDTRTGVAGGAAPGVSGVLPPDSVVQATNPNPNELPKQNIIDSIAAAVRALGPGYKAYITPQGGRAFRAAGTINHPLGDAMDHYLVFNGQRINPPQDPLLYRRYLSILLDNAAARGIRPGIGGYNSFIHYDESPWRQGKGSRAGLWSQGFDTSFLA
jgi:hypothetical protein